MVANLKGGLNMYWFLLFLLIPLVITYLPLFIRYSISDYKKISGNSIWKTIFDKGNYGEFLTFYYLEKLPRHKRLLTNIYIPKGDGTTTEIDLVMIDETGIYVFESKNYSGWIFGDEKSKMWTQSLQRRKKYRFFNPIWQNKAHITALHKYLANYDESFYKSYIVFSERCRLRKIKVTTTGVKVLNRQMLVKIIKNDIADSEVVLTKGQIDELYTILLKHALVDEHVKQQHIEDIKAKKVS